MFENSSDSELLETLFECGQSNRYSFSEEVQGELERRLKSKPFDSTSNTHNHIRLVQATGMEMLSVLAKRFQVHDLSKLQEPEKSGIDRVRPTLMALPYGTPEYDRIKREAFGDHHYAHNDHHTEYYANGIFGMTVEAFVEQYCDYVAAVMTHPNGNMYKSIEINADKLTPLGVALYTNSARAWGL